MLKQEIHKNLEAVVQMSLMNHGADETLSYDVSKQCVEEADVDKCLEIMLEHISEQELELMVKLIKSPMYQRYTQALTESIRVIDKRIETTLRLLTETGGRS